MRIKLVFRVLVTHALILQAKTFSLTGYTISLKLIKVILATILIQRIVESLSLHNKNITKKYIHTTDRYLYEINSIIFDRQASFSRTGRVGESRGSFS